MVIDVQRQHGFVAARALHFDGGEGEEIRGRAGASMVDEEEVEEAMPSVFYREKNRRKGVEEKRRYGLYFTRWRKLRE